MPIFAAAPAGMRAVIASFDVMEQPRSNSKNRKSDAARANSFLNEMGKTPPQALDMEEAVLGALLQQRDALSAVLDILKPESFYKESHKIIYQAIIDLFNESQEIDILSVSNKLRKSNMFEQIGGSYYLAYLTSIVNSAAHIEHHARIVSEMSIKRELIKISGEINRDAWEHSTDVFELLDSAEQKLFKIAETNITKNYADIADVVREALKEIENRKNHEDVLTGVPSGFASLDRITNGWQNSDLIIIAARPGMGKTAFILSAARNAAVQFKKGIAIFSLEMSAVQLVERLLSIEAELSSEKIKSGKLEEYEWRNLHQKADNLQKASIFIDDSSALTVLELRAKARRLKAQHDISLIMIDYLQLMSADMGGGKGGNREQDIAYISRSLKGLAKELNVPVIALSQLSRAVETRADRKPMLSDLRESGSIEQDADMVAFLYRPEYYKVMEDENGPTDGVGYVIIGKNRHGSLDEVRLRFIGQFTKFADMEDDLLGADFGGGNRSFTSAMGSMGIPSEFDSGPNSTIVMPSKLNRPGGPPDLTPNDDIPF